MKSLPAQRQERTGEVHRQIHSLEDNPRTLPVVQWDLAQQGHVCQLPGTPQRITTAERACGRRQTDGREGQSAHSCTPVRKIQRNAQKAGQVFIHPLGWLQISKFDCSGKCSRYCPQYHNSALEGFCFQSMTEQAPLLDRHPVDMLYAWGLACQHEHVNCLFYTYLDIEPLLILFWVRERIVSNKEKLNR